MTDTETKTKLSESAELSQDQIRDAEAHRGFVREMDQSLGKIYGIGGGSVLAVIVALVVVGWFMGWLTQLMLWVPGITAALVSLFIARRQIYARRDKLRGRVEKYCEANELSAQILLDYYRAQDTYPFFTAIFESGPEHLREQNRAALEQ